MKQSEKTDLLFRCSEVFSPAAPINTRSLFAGRAEQIRQAGHAVHTTGRHAIIFGERGVGKTSLANYLQILLADEKTLVGKVNCNSEDGFSRMWRNALSDITLSLQDEEFSGFHPIKSVKEFNPAAMIDDKCGPEDLRSILQKIGRVANTVFIFDEFDRLQKTKSQRIFADAIKYISDNAVNATLVIVGVANDVTGLIREHSSIDRSLVQIKMPRMQSEELRQIIDTAMSELGTTMTAEAQDMLILLSQGLPHFTHLLGLEATETAVGAGRKKVVLNDVKTGVRTSLEKTQHSVLDSYQQATAGQRKGTLFQEVLLACALAEVDEQGYFVSAGVREPLSILMGKPYDIPGFSQHLDKFSADQTRGPILEKTGTSRRFRFRFLNPLLQPYVIIRGLAEGKLKGDLLELLRRKQAAAARR